jgi:hypothetical protein
LRRVGIGGVLAGATLVGLSMPAWSENGLTRFLSGRGAFFGSDRTGRVACGDNGAGVAGNRDSIETTGVCTKIDISGNDNHVEVTLASGGRINITGRRNVVLWRTVDGSVPRVSDAGDSNSVRAAGGPVAKPPLRRAP